MTENDSRALAALQKHAKRFDKRIEKVTDGIYSAIGYALGNSILIVTKEGNIVVDTTESFHAAQEIKEAFHAISPLPTIAVIYSHGHFDHVLGAQAFVEDGTAVYAHSKVKNMLNNQFSKFRPIHYIRQMRQFGLNVPERKEHIPCYGLGPDFKREFTNPRFVIPTHTFDDSMEIEIGELKLELVHAPGETKDTIFIWIPEKKTLLCADNYYPCFPNLYTIGGTSPRPVKKWIQSIDKLRDRSAEYLVPSHAGPIYGEKNIYEFLTVHRDAIQYVHDAVVRGVNLDKTKEQLAEEIQLPPSLSGYTELRQLYGDISQCVRGIYDGYMGWFDGNATNLMPLPTRTRAEKLITLAGGFEQMMSEAQSALDNREYQWAAEVSDLMLAVSPDSREVRKIKSDALFQMGLLTYNSNNRSYYLQQALELKGDVKYPPFSPEEQLLYDELIPIDQFLSNMSARLDPMISQNEMISVAIYITDTSTQFQAHIRHGIAEIREGMTMNPDLRIVSKSRAWKEIVLGVNEPQNAIESGEIQLDGDIKQLDRFLRLFKV